MAILRNVCGYAVFYSVLLSEYGAIYCRGWCIYAQKKPGVYRVFFAIL